MRLMSTPDQTRAVPDLRAMWLGFFACHMNNQAATGAAKCGMPTVHNIEHHKSMNP